jgi:O-antigen/teichoic acid export membrane protein
LLKRIRRVFGANIFGQFVTILVQVISVPFFLHFWGTKIYGEWLLLTALPSYIVVSGTGIGYVTGNTMQKNIALEQTGEALAVFQSAWVATIGISIALIGFILPTIFYFPILKWLNIKSIPTSAAHLTLILFSIYVLLSFQIELFVGVYRSIGKFAKGITITNLLRLIEFAGTIIVILASGRFVGVSFLLLSVRLVAVICISRDLGLIPWMRFGYKHANLRIIKSEFSSTICFLGFPLGHACLIQGMTTIVGIRLGPGSVVVFSAIRTMTGFIKQFSSTIYYSIWPELTNTLSKGKIKIARNLHRNAFQITLLFSFFCSIMIYAFGNSIFSIWTGGKLRVENAFLFLMLISTIPNTLWMMSSYVSISINRHSLIALFYCCFAFAAMCLSYFLIPHFGLLAVPFSTLFCDLSTLIFVLNRSFGIVKETSKGFSLFMFSNNPFQNLLKMSH